MYLNISFLNITPKVQAIKAITLIIITPTILPSAKFAPIKEDATKAGILPIIENIIKCLMVMLLKAQTIISESLGAPGKKNSITNISLNLGLFKIFSN